MAKVPVVLLQYARGSHCFMHWAGLQDSSLSECPQATLNTERYIHPDVQIASSYSYAMVQHFV
jgi:hypothetical protein